ncbi:MAG: dihydrodipicolinate reductase [Rhodothermales bacterium]|nr:dihydrodipicolinate reductase [Rhodothermales bacterium]
MSKPMNVVQFGIGPIGLESVKTILQKQSTGKIRLVGVIDIDPNKIGKDVGHLLAEPVDTGVIVSSDAAAVLESVDVDVVVHTTSSFLDSMYDQLVLCAEKGANVVSSTEELSYPYERHPQIAEKIDAVAKRYGVTIVGTGVNPGYAMDVLALTATGVSTDVHRVRISRVVDAGKRRKPLQAKVGAGISAEEFAEKKATGKFGHIGLRESLLMVADGLGWELTSAEENLDPVISTKKVITPYFTVEEGAVAGIHHSIKGFVGSDAVITLDLQMYVGADDPHDAVFVEGTPPIDLIVRGGIFGDTATIAALVNAIPLAASSDPGLKTVKDLPVPRAFATVPQ